MVAEKSDHGWPKVVTVALPSTGGVIGGSLIIMKLLDVIKDADSERLASYTALLAQLGTVPVIALVAMFIVVWGARSAIHGRDLAIQALRKSDDQVHKK